MIRNTWCLLVTVALLPVAQADAQPATPPIESAAAMVTVGGANWAFSCGDAGKGLDVRWQSGDAIEAFQVDFGGAVGRVIDVAAAARQYDGNVGIALAIASQKSPGDEIEYRLAWARGTGSISDSAAWLCSQPVQTVSADDAYHLLSIAIPTGDSVMMTMQRLTRVSGSGNKIETYVVLNHCPVGSENRLLKMHSPHYYSVMTEPVEQQQTQDAANSESGRNAGDK